MRAAGIGGSIEAHIEAVEAEARERAAAIVAKAEREAEEVRGETKELVEKARQRVNELMRLRQALFASMREVLGDFDSAIVRAEEERNFDLEPTAPPAEAPEDDEGVDAADKGPAKKEVETEEPASAPPPAPSPQLAEPEQQQDFGLGPSVQVQVKTLGDYTAVNAVEGELKGLSPNFAVQLRSFDDGVASFEVFGTQGVDMLLGAIRSSFSIAYILRDAKPGHVVLQVDEFAARQESG